MFAPKPYREDDVAILHALIEEATLGTLVTGGAKESAAPGLVASHLPFMLDRNRGPLGTLIGHVDRRNPQWRLLDSQAELLVTFLGPDTGVSAGWYGTTPRVPTWLYTTVHCYGTARLVQDADGLRDMVVQLSERMEPPGSAWSGGQVETYIDKLLGGIVGFEIDITRLEGQRRLAQQNGPDDRRRVLAALEAGTHRQRHVAEAMRRLDQPAE